MRRSLIAVALALTPAVSQGAVIQWTDWTGSNLASATGSVDGIGVSFTGTLEFAQLGLGNKVGLGGDANTNYWTEPAPGPAPYTGNAIVSNAPTAYELLAFNTSSVNKLVFSAPVYNPIMAIVSMGQSGLPVSYDFDMPFIVLSEGRGFWGDGTYSVEAGDVLIGRELHAVIQFQGTVSEIEWASSAENWHGFSVGLAPVPEPGTVGLVLAGLIGLGWQANRRRR